MNLATVDASMGDQSRSLRRRLAIEASALAGCLVVMAPFAFWRAGWPGVAAAATAVGVCGLAAVAASLVGQLFPPDMPHYQLLGGMLPRMGIPLGVCVWFYAAVRGPLVAAGLVFYLLATYLVMLAVETWLILPATSARNDGPPRNPQDS